MTKRPTKKEREEIERKRQEQILINKRKESKFQLISNISRLRDTLRHHKRLMRQVSLYLKEEESNFKHIDEITEKVQSLNNDLENLIEFKTVRRFYSSYK